MKKRGQPLLGEDGQPLIRGVFARPLLERALAIREKALGPEHPETATSLDHLARLIYEEGDLGAARPLVERALAIREKALGPEYPETATSLDRLARLIREEHMQARRPSWMETASP